MSDDLIPADESEEIARIKAATGMSPCWIVWEAATDGGRPYLVSIDTSQEMAARHVRSKKEEARTRDRPPPMLRVEQSWLDHLYGESMTKSFDEIKKMAAEVHKQVKHKQGDTAPEPTLGELRQRLRRAIAIGASALQSSSLDRTHDDLEELHALKRGL